MPTNTYANYYKRLAGEKLPVYAEEPDLGYYAIPTRDKTGWRRVNYQLDKNDNITCFVNGKEQPKYATGNDPDEVPWAPAWAWAVKRPIDDAAYKMHTKTGRMPWESEAVAADRNGASLIQNENQNIGASQSLGTDPNLRENPKGNGNQNDSDSNVLPFQPAARFALTQQAERQRAATAVRDRVQGLASASSTTTGATSSNAHTAETNGQTTMDANSAERGRQGDSPFPATTAPYVIGPALAPDAASATNQPTTSAIDDFKDRLAKLQIEADTILKKPVAELDRDTANRLGGLASRFTEIEKSANEARVIEKQPHYTLCVQIDSKWKKVTEAAADYKKKTKGRGNEYIDLQNKKVEEERAAQIAAGAPQETLTPQEPIRLGDGLGRALHQRITMIAVITDRAEFLKQEQVQAHSIMDKALQDIANAFVKAGILCPGLKAEEQSQAV